MSAIAKFASRFQNNSAVVSANSVPTVVPNSVELLSPKQSFRLQDFMNRKNLLALQDEFVSERVNWVLDDENIDPENSDYKLRFPRIAELSKDDAKKMISVMYHLPVVGFSSVVTTQTVAKPAVDIAAIDKQIASAMSQFDAIKSAIDNFAAAGIETVNLESRLSATGELLAELKKAKDSAVQAASVTKNTVPSVPTTSEKVTVPVMGIHESATQPGLRFEVHTTLTGQIRVKVI